ncbi:aldo/keto reductase [Kineosporia babensis]|uniref:Aldo/keto reductase n=1 Tax=Kineosporia babensis TaxID=499548 RepID=A0A9X1NIX8_9ACTN|nr:aldo/keto reductase [Kineosporia babensis]MCD5314925.1 aldo/keto reductase [Kineosporia babensis]
MTAILSRYSTMPYRRAGASGLDLPAFSFGLWQKFGPDHPYQTQREILLRAFDLGVTHFDNANRYGPPFRAAEKTFGRLLKQDLAAHRDELVLSTKAGNPIGPGPYQRGGSRKSLLTSLDHSLRDLGTDYVDIFYHHRHDPGTPLEETASALATAVQSGKARYVGISNYEPGFAAELVALLNRRGVRLLVHQPRYSLFDRSPEDNRLLEVSSELGFGLVVYSPLAQGLLTKKYLAASIPPGARALDSAFLKPSQIDETYRRRATGLNRIAEARGQSLAQLALQWVLRRPEVTSALIGASSTWQLEHNLKALDFPPFTTGELELIDEFGVHGTGSTG